MQRIEDVKAVLLSVVVFLTLLTLLTLLSCNKQSEYNLDVTFLGDGVDEIELKAIEFGLADSVSRPRRCIIIDSLLIGTEGFGDFHYYVFDLRTNSIVTRFGAKGRGPGEYVTAWCLSVRKNGTEFSVFDPSLKKLGIYSIKDRIPVLVNEIYMNYSGFIIYCDWLDNDLLACTTFSGEGRLAIYNITTEKFTYFSNSTPPNRRNAPLDIHGHSYHSLISTSPDGTKMALAARYSDQIGLYTKDGDKILDIVGPEGYSPIFVVDSYNDMPVFAELPETKMAYTGIACTNDLIYALYSGRTHKEFPGDDGEGSLVVNVFDWSGTFVKKYSLDKPIGSLEIDESDSFLYGVSLGFNGLNDVLYFEIN